MGRVILGLSSDHAPPGPPLDASRVMRHCAHSRHLCSSPHGVTRVWPFARKLVRWIGRRSIAHDMPPDESNQMTQYGPRLAWRSPRRAILFFVDSCRRQLTPCSSLVARRGHKGEGFISADHTPVLGDSFLFVAVKSRHRGADKLSRCHLPQRLDLLSRGTRNGHDVA